MTPWHIQFTKSPWEDIAKIIVGFTILILGCYLVVQIANGTPELDYDYTQCMRGLQEYCDKIEIERLYEQLLNRTIEWNELHGNR